MKLGVVLLDGSAGLESIVVFGAVRSTFAVAVTAVETLPTLSAIVKL